MYSNHLFCDSGADANAVDLLGKTALDYAEIGCHKSCVQLLVTALDIPSLVAKTPQSTPMATPQKAPQMSAMAVTASTSALPAQDETSASANLFPDTAQLFRLLTAGFYLYKHTNNGRGPVHTRYGGAVLVMICVSCLGFGVC